VQKKNLS